MGRKATESKKQSAEPALNLVARDNEPDSAGLRDYDEALRSSVTLPSQVKMKLKYPLRMRAECQEGKLSKWGDPHDYAQGRLCS